MRFVAQEAPGTIAAKILKMPAGMPTLPAKARFCEYLCVSKNDTGGIL